MDSKYIYVLIVIFANLTGSSSRDNRIVGGSKIEVGEAPYQLSLRRAWNNAHFCGASLIGRGLVLTAAHCCRWSWGGDVSPFSIKVVAGQTNLTITENSIFRLVKKVNIHEEYDHDTMANDICILETEEPFPLDNSNICMVALNDMPLAENTNCIVSGWGAQSHDTQVASESLYATNITIISKSKCQEKYNAAGITLTSSMMCAGVSDGSTDACQGDSGGPMYYNGRQVGIVSTGIGCADPDYPGIYTNVATMLPWIYKFIKQEQLQYDSYSSSG